MIAAFIILAALALLVMIGAVSSLMFDPGEIDREERRVAYRGLR